MTPWDHVRALPDDTEPIPLAVRPPSLRLVLGDAEYDRVPDTGWTMLIAWLAGPDHLVRLPDREPRPAADQNDIDSGLEEYLAEARIPAPPRGNRWYQRVPAGHGSLEKAYSRLNAHLAEVDPSGEAIRPEQIAPLLADAVAALYPR